MDMTNRDNHVTASSVFGGCYLAAGVRASMNAGWATFQDGMLSTATLGQEVAAIFLPMLDGVPHVEALLPPGSTGIVARAPWFQARVISVICRGPI